jgi:hypothetical protein
MKSVTTDRDGKKMMMSENRETDFPPSPMMRLGLDRAARCGSTSADSRDVKE